MVSQIIYAEKCLHTTIHKLAENRNIIIMGVRAAFHTAFIIFHQIFNILTLNIVQSWLSISAE